MCIYHLLNLVSTSQNDPSRIQQRRTAYARTKESFEVEKVELMKYLDSCSKIECIHANQWALYVVPEILFGRLSPQLSESFNAYMLHHGMRQCSPFKNLAFISTKFGDNFNRKLIEANELYQRGVLVTKSFTNEINMRRSQFPAMNVSDNDTSVTLGNIVGRVWFRSKRNDLSFDMKIKRQAEVSELHKFSCTYTATLDIPCTHLIAFQHRLSLNSRIPNIPQIETPVHSHRSVAQFKFL